MLKTEKVKGANFKILLFFSLRVVKVDGNQAESTKHEGEEMSQY